jgi:hypothetical protein
MFGIIINNMIKNEKIKKYLINFKIKEYSNKNHANLKKIVKKRDLKIEI